MVVAYISERANFCENFLGLAQNEKEVKKAIIGKSISEVFKDKMAEPIGVAFVHIDCESFPEELYACIKEKSPETEIVFVSDDKDYCIKAFTMDVLAYVTYPVDESLLNKIVRKAQMLKSVATVTKPYIKTFGNFDVFVDGKVVMFSNKKAKELLALLVDKCGGSLNMEQIIDVLWEDRPFDENTKTLYRIALKNLRDTLAKVGAAEMLIETRGQRSVDTGKVDCDYYDLLKQKKQKGVFDGEYMTNYSWGEYTLAKIYEIYG